MGAATATVPVDHRHATPVDWMASWATVGVEGIVSKALDSPYVTGSREWVKIKHRTTVDVLTPARSGHPWPDTVTSHRFGTDRVPLVRVDPLVVAGVAVDAAHDGGVWRHPARWQRTRPDLRPGDVPLLGAVG